MKVITRLVLCSLLCAAATGCLHDPRPLPTTRSVHLAPATESDDDESDFDPAQSSALFVGVRRFTHDGSLVEVRYAVDDAIDLASVFALDIHLVDPAKVVLAISGEPQKPSSKQKLEELRAAGATIRDAGESDILALLDRQTRNAGKKGIFIVSVATHGFNDEGSHYLLASNSLLQHRQTSISANTLVEIAGQSDALRSLIFLDSCRTKLVSGIRSEGASDRRSAAPLVQTLGSARSQAVFYAAAANQYAYDDDERKNGVFTAAVIDGLHCQATTNARGLITVDTLFDYVNRRVLTWIRTHRDPLAKRGIQLTTDGMSKAMPLVACGTPPTQIGQVLHAFREAMEPNHKDIFPIGSAADKRQKPATVRASDHVVEVFNAAGTHLWGRRVRGTIVQAEAVDLDGDGMNEVIVGVGGPGEDAGKIVVCNGNGTLLWTGDTNAPANDDLPSGSRLTVRAFTTGDLFRSCRRQVVALAVDVQAGHPSRLCIFENDGKLSASYWHPGELRTAVVGSATAHDEPRIIVGGVNNDLRPIVSIEGNVPIVFMLDPAKVAGEAPPYLGRSGRGTQLWYGLVLPAKQTIDRVEVVDRQNGANDIAVSMSSRIVLHLDFGGQLVSITRGEESAREVTFAIVGEK